MAFADFGLGRPVRRAHCHYDEGLFLDAFDLIGLNGDDLRHRSSCDKSLFD